MNDIVRRTPPGVRLLALLLASAGLAACDRPGTEARTSDKAQVASSSTASTGALMGIPPAEPQGDTPQTTSPPATKELTKSEEVSEMPQPGQPNDHSNLAPNASQKAGAADPQMTPDRRQP